MNVAALASAFLVIVLGMSCSRRPTLVSSADPRARVAAPDEGVRGFPDSITSGWGLPPLVGDSTAHVFGDTVLHADVTVHGAYALSAEQAGGSPPARPMRLSARALARDTSQGRRARRLPIAYASCPFVLRLYRGRDRMGMPAWRSDAAIQRELACPPAPRDASRGEVTVEWEVPAVLGDSLAAGHYAFSYAVRLADGRVLEYEAGGGYLSSDPRPPTRERSTLRMKARSEVVGQAPRKLRTIVTVVNAGRRAVRLEHGDCTPLVRLYRTPRRTGEPVWRSELRSPPGHTGGYDCIAILRITQIAPGDSAMLGPAIPLYEVLGDSLLAGRYYVGAELELLDRELPPGRRETVYRIAAGEVELTRAPDRLSATRTVDGLTYAATTRLVRGAAPDTGTVRTLVSVTNTTRKRVTTSVPRDCPVLAYAYRSAALRDSVPARAAAWSPPERCYNYEHRFALEPGQSWVFAHDALASEIVARAGPGRYWFTALIAGRTGVFLAAGDVQLGR
jgi:hypothetical protein